MFVLYIIFIFKSNVFRLSIFKPKTTILLSNQAMEVSSFVYFVLTMLNL